MITFFTTCKPFRGHDGIIQRNALKSWTLLHPDVEVMVFGDEEGGADVCSEYGLRHEPYAERHPSRMPYLDWMFARASEIARHPYLCYANCDIVLMDDFWRAFKVAIAWREKFLLVSRRWDTDINELIDFGRRDWPSSLQELARKQGKQQNEFWIDVFLFTKGLYSDMPRLIVGYCYWDNWMIGKALSMKIPVLDASRYAMLLHQKHGYTAQSGRIKGLSTDPLSLYNRGVIPNRAHILQIDSATHRLTSRGAVRLHLVRRIPSLLRKIGFTGNKVAWVLRTFVWHPLLDLTRPLRSALGLRSQTARRSGGKD